MEWLHYKTFDDTMKKNAFLMMALFVATQFLDAQTWIQTSAPSNTWSCLAASADGSVLVAGQSPGSVYVSTNSGAAWTPGIVANQYWASVAASADGTRLVAAAEYVSADYPGGIFVSTNSGSTWTTNSLSAADMYWSSVASSADGQTLAAVAPYMDLPLGSDPGAVFSSTNAGTTWVSNSIDNAIGLAMSADGTKMIVVAFPQVWRSTNSGASWTPDAAAPAVDSWGPRSQFIASSADGNKLALCVLSAPDNSFLGQIYLSTNFGDAWNPSTAPTNHWNFLASSADGKTLLAAPSYVWPGPLYVSTNFGATWSTNNSPLQGWGAVASSADGGKWFADVTTDTNGDAGTGPIYLSQSIPSPWLNITPASGASTLSWLVPSTNFVLEQSSDLFNWLEVTNAPVLDLNNLQDEVVLSPTNNLGFYRLRTP
jgi:hypothetical protein